MGVSHGGRMGVRQPDSMQPMPAGVIWVSVSQTRYMGVVWVSARLDVSHASERCSRFSGRYGFA